MKLRSRTLLLSGVIMLVLILVLLAISQFIFISNYGDIETRYSNHVLNDELSKFNYTVSAMDQTAQDWAQWDDAYSFVSGGNPGFVTNNLPSNIFKRLNLNLIMFIDNNGRIVYGQAYDLDTNKSMNLPQNLTNLNNNSPLLQHGDLNGLKGVVDFPEGPMILISRPIVNSHEEGPVKGTLIMGRYLTQDELNGMINIPNSTLSAVGYNDTGMSSDFSKVIPTLSNSSPQKVLILGSDSIAAYRLINDIYGNPAVVLKSEMSRSLYKTYINTIFYFIGSILLVGLVFIVTILYSLDRNVLQRLDLLISEILDIGKKGDLKRRVSISGEDELTDLAASINSSLMALLKSEKNLEESEKKYRSIFENTGTAMIIIEEDTTISLVNRTFERFLNLGKDEIEGEMKWIDMIVPADKSRVKGYHIIRDEDNISSGIIPKNYEVMVRVGEDTRDFFATYDRIPGTKKSLISLIDITDRKKAEGLLKDSLKEKELLLREIHHRVKNSLQIISSLLSLQAAEMDDEDIVERYRESENRIHTIALIHESLYQSTDISSVNFKNYVDILMEDMMHSYHAADRIKTTLKLGDYNLGLETAIPAGLIINELVSNALKHAFKDDEEGEIILSLDKIEDGYCLTIKDNGVGLPDGVSVDNPDSLGLQLVNALVSQLEGKIEVVRDGGTMFKIVIKELVYTERF